MDNTTRILLCNNKIKRLQMLLNIAEEAGDIIEYESLSNQIQEAIQELNNVGL